MQSDRDKAKEADKEPKTPKEDFKVVTKKKKLVPKQLIEISLNKDKADKFKKEVQHNCGVRTMYWNHTKNYSPFNKQEEENYVAEKVKKYRLSKFLSFFIEKNYHYSLLRRFIKEYTKESPFNPEDRYKVR